MAEETLRLGIDATGAREGARVFVRGTDAVQQGATKADAAVRRVEGAFERLRGAAGMAVKVMGVLGITLGAGAFSRSIARATADMDTLRLSLNAVTGSSVATARQLEALKEVAKLPGLGFKEAVQGAVNLEVVGFEAEKTTRILTAFGNAVALTGGGKNELDRVMQQFVQMSSLGKVTSQDLKPIIQTAPAVAKAMLEVFGTISPDKIEGMGLTFEQFTERLLGGLEKLPQATGGVRNSFENLTDATFQASAAFGTHFAPAVASILNPLADSLQSLADNGREMRKLADGVRALGEALLIGGAVVGVVRLAKALRDVEIATAALQALKGPQGWLILGVAALATKLYAQGAAARDAADALDQYKTSLAGLSKEDLLSKNQGLSANYAIVAAQVKHQEGVVRDLRRRVSFGGASGLDLDDANRKLESYRRTLGGLAQQIKAVRSAREAVEGKTEAGPTTNPDVDKAVASVQALGDKLRTQAVAQAIATGNWQAYDKALKDADAATNKLIGSEMERLQQQGVAAASLAPLASLFKDTYGEARDAAEKHRKKLEETRKELERLTVAASGYQAAIATVTTDGPTRLSNGLAIDPAAAARAGVEMAERKRLDPLLDLTPKEVARVAPPKVTFGERARSALSQVGEGNFKGALSTLGVSLAPLAAAAIALAPVFQGLRETLGPVISKLARPLQVMGRILGDVVAPVLEVLQRPLEMIATLFSVLAQPLRLMVHLFTAYITPGLKIVSGALKIVTSGLSYIVEGIGYVVKGLGNVVDKLVPDFISKAGKGLATTGQDIIDGAKRARQGFDAVAAASDKLASTLSTDLPRAINLALYRSRMGVPGGLGSGGGGGGAVPGGGPYTPPPAPNPGRGPIGPHTAQTLYFAPGSVVNSAGDDEVTLARKMAKGAQILASQGVPLVMPGLVTV